MNNGIKKELKQMENSEKRIVDYEDLEVREKLMRSKSQSRRNHSQLNFNEQDLQKFNFEMNNELTQRQRRNQSIVFKVERSARLMEMQEKNKEQ